MALPLVVITASALPGCSLGARVQIHSGAEARYLETWAKDWGLIRRDVMPLAPTSSSSGACNKGRSQALCLTVSRVLLTDFEKLDQDLSGSWVPTSLRSANEQVLRAVSEEIRGLRLRVSALEDKDDSAWEEANDVFRRVGSMFTQAYEQFPDELKPSPAPFG